MGFWKHLHVKVDQGVALFFDFAKQEPCSRPCALEVHIWPLLSFTPPDRMRMGGAQEN